MDKMNLAEGIMSIGHILGAEEQANKRFTSIKGNIYTPHYGKKQAEKDRKRMEKAHQAHIKNIEYYEKDCFLCLEQAEHDRADYEYEQSTLHG